MLPFGLSLLLSFQVFTCRLVTFCNKLCVYIGVSVGNTPFVSICCSLGMKYKAPLEAKKRSVIPLLRADTAIAMCVTSMDNFDRSKLVGFPGPVGSFALNKGAYTIAPTFA